MAERNINEKRYRVNFILIESIIWLVVTIFMYHGLYKNKSWKDTSGKILTYRTLTLIGLIISVILLVI